MLSEYLLIMFLDRVKFKKRYVFVKYDNYGVAYSSPKLWSVNWRLYINDKPNPNYAIAKGMDSQASIDDQTFYVFLITPKEDERWKKDWRCLRTYDTLAKAKLAVLRHIYYGQDKI